ncbi:DUF4214 domain-containing protein [Brevundimonas goettingensis]|uniref:DUF4214 domain-containing protein n=1 Tax=Brevundimonas goettingensis TaxID=2774190 RepID=A0A975C525_9CAUL|nr:DUF4214 domain-containing protein [Brevundimonas goettingensis]QTC91702.1 DUF4214 domain-containing protein [Brevundimonas goettingensis]
MTITLNSNFVIERDEVYTTTSGPAFYANALNAIEFVNYGVIRASGPGAVGFASYVSSGLVHNVGVIEVNSTDTAYGFSSPQWCAAIRNSGQVTVTGSSAYGLYSWSPSQVFDNSGKLTVTGTNTATGVYVVNGGKLSNTGSITVSGGTSATGVYIDRFEGGVFENKGTIIATATGQSFGLVVSGLAQAVTGPNIINRGVITADIAVYGRDGGYSPSQPTIENVANYGVLNGDIILGAGADVLRNYNVINGDVDMGSGADTVDLTGGWVNGIFDLGEDDDTALGSAGDDVFYGYLGRDTIRGAGGNDYIDGEQGNDTLFGGAGNDRLYGGSGSDTISGDEGDDIIDGGTGDDVIDGGTGTDTIVYSGVSTAFTITTSNGVTTITGSATGTDTLTNVERVQFSDRILDITPRTTLNGTTGADVLAGTSGADIINGLAGNDVLTGGAGSDQINGGDGIDTAAYAGIRRQYGTANSSTVVGGPEGGADTLTSIENARFVDGTLTFDVDSASAQVMRLYDAALGRHYDEAGLEGQAAWIANGTITLRTLADAFVHSAEFLDRFGALDNRTFIEQLYRFSLGRDGEPEGVNGWTASLNAGMSRGDVVIGFSESAEHRGLTQAVLNQGLWVADQQALIIARLYDATFDRLPDSAGLIGWTASLKGGMALSQIASGFADSPEFQARYGGLSNWDFVAQLFRFCLNREGDPAGIQNWVNNIDAGLRTRAQVLLEFSESQEHVNLTTPNMLAGIQTFDYHSSPAEVVGDAAAKAAAEPLVLPTLTSEDGPGDALVLPAMASEDAAIKDVALTLPALIHDDAFVLPAEVALAPLVLPADDGTDGTGDEASAALTHTPLTGATPEAGHDTALTLSDDPEWAAHHIPARLNDTGHWTLH